MKKNKKLYFYLINVIIFFVFLFIASFLDLEISQVFASLKPLEYYTTNPLAIIIEIFGESIMFVMLGLGFSILYFASKKLLRTKWKHFFCVGLYLFLFLTNFIMIHRIIKYLSIYFSIEKTFLGLVLMLLLSFVYSKCLMLVVDNIPKKYLPKLIKFSVFVILVVLTVCVVVQVLKNEIFRLRFRGLNALNDFSYFTNWWENKSLAPNDPLLFFNLPKDAFRSFPSGHSALSATLFCLWAFSSLTGIVLTKKQSKYIYGFSVLYVLMVGFGRILAGAHYLSDVLFGVLLSWLVIAFWFVVMKKIKFFKIV